MAVRFLTPNGFALTFRKEMILFVWMGAFLVLGSGFPHLSKEEDMKKHIRKPKLYSTTAFKTIESENGDIFDCVDIYRQPAFNHPLLKNHNVQLVPESLSEVSPLKKSDESEIIFMDEECPNGTIPILRTPLTDNAMPELIPTYHENNSSGILLDASPKIFSQMAIHYASNDYHGLRGYLNVYGLPDLNYNQLSTSSIVLSKTDGGKLNVIQAGWMVNPSLFGDSKTRSYIYWMGKGHDDGRGCYNLLCGGFLQVDSSIGIGGEVKPLSTIGGPQYDLRLEILKEQNSGNWWLSIADKRVGYWPKELFSNSLSERASEMKVGGLVVYVEGTPGPAMGSGSYKTMGPKPCYAGHIRTYNLENEAHEVDFEDANPYASKRECYKVSDLWSSRFYFGGPAGCD